MASKAYFAQTIDVFNTEALFSTDARRRAKKINANFPLLKPLQQLQKASGIRITDRDDLIGNRYPVFLDVVNFVDSDQK